MEKDPARLAARLKQIAFGKNTVGYDNYIDAVPKYVRFVYVSQALCVLQYLSVSTLVTV